MQVKHYMIMLLGYTEPTPNPRGYCRESALVGERYA
jgi:hypothetical protein